MAKAAEKVAAKAADKAAVDDNADTPRPPMLSDYGLALSAGVTLYVAASDLIPEVNKTRSPKYALTVALGVAMVLVMRYLFFSF